jgi:hypothetical protein
MASLGASAAAFSWVAQMNYQTFTNDSLTMMYEAVRGALAADDGLKRRGLPVRFRVRETLDWNKYAADLEAEMLRRGMRFEVIDWSEDRSTGWTLRQRASVRRADQDYPLENGLSAAHIPDMNGQLREYLINGAMILAVLLVVYGFVHFYGYPSQTP